MNMIVDGWSCLKAPARTSNRTKRPKGPEGEKVLMQYRTICVECF